MTARIYKPAKSAMQQGQSKQDWTLEYEPDEPRVIEPLMGWTSSGDMKQQLRLRFETKEEAVAYCERNGIAFEVFDSQLPQRSRVAYADNFAPTRRGAWTH